MKNMVEYKKYRRLFFLIDVFLATIMATLIGGISYVAAHYDKFARFRVSFSHTQYDSVIFLMVFPICGILLLFAIWKAGKEAKINATIMIGAIIFTLYVIQGGFLFYGLYEDAIDIFDYVMSPQQPSHVDTLQIRRKMLAEQAGKPYDTREKIDVLQQLRQDGIEAFPDVSPYLFYLPEAYRPLPLLKIEGQTIFPLSGIRNAHTVLCNEAGEWIRYVSDEYGFHNPAGWSALKQIEVAVLGDSHAHGLCVSSEKNFAALLRQTYPQTINFGRNGIGPLSELGIFREYVERYKPSTVIWVYSGNDLYNLEWEKNQPLLMKYLDPNYQQGLIKKQAQIDDSLINIINDRIAAEKQSLRNEREVSLQPELKEFFQKVCSIPTQWLLLQNLRWRFYRFLPQSEPDSDAIQPDVTTVTTQIPETMPPSGSGYPYDYRLFLRILLTAQAAASAWGGEFRLVILEGGGTQAASVETQQVIAFAESSNIAVIRADQALHDYPDVADLWPYGVIGGHYGEIGHRVIADIIRQEIETKKQTH